jgi:hypothetical protein
MVTAILATAAVLAVALSWDSLCNEIRRTLRSSPKDVNWPRWLALHLTIVAALLVWVSLTINNGVLQMSIAGFWVLTGAALTGRRPCELGRGDNASEFLVPLDKGNWIALVAAVALGVIGRFSQFWAMRLWCFFFSFYAIRSGHIVAAPTPASYCSAGTEHRRHATLFCRNRPAMFRLGRGRPDHRCDE